MRNKYLWIALSVAVATVAVVVVVFAGSPDNPPGPPESTYSYTLEDIYQRLDTGAAGTPITFTEPISGPGTGTMHTLNEIYDLIGERAPVPKTGQTIPDTTGDDGVLQMGVAWPVPRFITGTTGVVTDTLTGLIWLENAHCAKTTTDWSTALLGYITNLNAFGTMNGYDCGDTSNGGSHQTDWRLPNVREMQSLVHYGFYNLSLPNTAGTGQYSPGDPFTGVQPWYYWTSTTRASNASYAWSVDMRNGAVEQNLRTSLYDVWPVRGGQ
jgi:hypothetical protein